MSSKTRSVIEIDRDISAVRQNLEALRSERKQSVAFNTDLRKYLKVGDILVSIHDPYYFGIVTKVSLREVTVDAMTVNPDYGNAGYSTDLTISVPYIMTDGNDYALWRKSTRKEFSKRVRKALAVARRTESQLNRALLKVVTK
jgi:hypothetical protein